MTYLQLINSVLVRLREQEITAEEFDAGNNPYWKFIGSAVNDAKDRVEDAWQWSALRGIDSVNLDATNESNFIINSAGVPEVRNYIEGNTVAIPNSIDSKYIIKRIFVFPTTLSGFFIVQDKTKATTNLSWITTDAMDSRYQIPNPTTTGLPSEFAVTGQVSGNRPINSSNSKLAGSLKITIYPPTVKNATFQDTKLGLGIEGVRQQTPLVASSDRLFVPSLPVYTLATALASRERGEVGGAPTSELFATADRHLSDAISIDSALFANELNWYANDQDYNTNVRFA